MAVNLPMQYVLPIALALVTVGAVAMTQLNAHADPMDRYLAAPEWADGDCEQGRLGRTYVGLTQPELRASLGEAEVDHRFALGTGVNEFTVGLLKVYSVDDEPDREIFQQTWSHGGCYLTIWSSEEDGAMRSVDRLRYAEGVDF